MVMLQAATLGLKAPSSLSTGAAVPSTKEAMLAQPSDSSPGQGQPAAAPAAAAATAGKPARPAVAKRSMEGLDEAAVRSIKALCQVSMAVQLASVVTSAVMYALCFDKSNMHVIDIIVKHLDADC